MNVDSRAGRPTLVIDTSTRLSLVALARDRVESVSRRDVRRRHGSHVLEQIDEVLSVARASLDDIGTLVVGTGPGSFTGLRVGLATAKTIAYTRSLPLIGVMSSAALRRAAADAGAAADAAVVLPAGAHDHYLARAGTDAVLVPPGSLVDELGDAAVLTVDAGPEPLGEKAERLGQTALDGLADALLALGRERFEDSNDGDDIAELVPAYVALPRGVARAADELGWSPDLR